MSWIPGLLARNWKLKLASLCLAFLLWTSLRVEAVDRQVLPSIPVRVQLNDPQWAVRSDPEPPTVEVQFSGPAGELMGLYLDRPTVIVPVDAVSSADTSVLLRSEWVRLPNRPDVTVEEIRPRRIALSFEPTNRAVAPVSIRTVDSIPPGLAFAQPLSSEPEVVRISGPASQLEQVDSVSLVALDLSNVSATGSRVLPVDTTGLYGLVVSPARVRVDYVVEARARRELGDVPIVPEAGQDDIEVEPNTTDVTIVGARSLVDGVAPGSVWIEVSAGPGGLEPGEERVVPLRVRGIPDLVTAEPAVQEAVVRRSGSSAP